MSCSRVQKVSSETRASERFPRRRWIVADTYGANLITILGEIVFA